MKPEITSLFFKLRCQIQTFEKDKKMGLFRQFICCLQNFGFDKSAWKVNKEYSVAIEFCLHNYFLESRWNDLQIRLLLSAVYYSGK
jgi:hypothetical protein